MLGTLLAVASMELICRLLPVSTSTDTGYHVAPRILTYPPGHTFTVSTGWALLNARRHTSNNFGFLSERDFTTDTHAVAVIGDSLVEANMLADDQRLGSRLDRALGGNVPVYSMGGPGSSLLDYTERVQFARSRFGVRTFVVVIESGDVWQTICGSGNIHGPCLDGDSLDERVELQAPPGTLKRIVRESAFAQYLFSQLKVDPKAMLGRLTGAFRGSTRAAGAPTASEAARDKAHRDSAIIIGKFLDRLRIAPGERVILVVDCDCATGASSRKDPDAERLELMRRAQERGIAVLDLAPVFARYLARERRALVVGPYDHHWNGVANSLIATELVPLLTAAPESAPR